MNVLILISDPFIIWKENWYGLLCKSYKKKNKKLNKILFSEGRGFLNNNQYITWVLLLLEVEPCELLELRASVGLGMCQLFSRSAGIWNYIKTYSHSKFSQKIYYMFKKVYTYKSSYLNYFVLITAKCNISNSKWVLLPGNESSKYENVLNVYHLWKIDTL